MAELSGYRQRIRERKRWLVNNKPPEEQAAEAGVPLPDILAANPEVNQLVPGMVLNLPGERRDPFSVSNPYAPLGQPGGTLGYTPVQHAYRGSSPSLFQNAVSALPDGQPSLFSQAVGALQKFGDGRPSIFQAATSTLPPPTGLSTFDRARLAAGGQIGQPSLFQNAVGAVQPQAPVAPPPVVPQYKSLGSHQTESRFVEELFTKTQNFGYVPTEGELKYLMDTGRIRPVSEQSPTSGGYGGYGGGGRRRGGGGRGGRPSGGGGGPRYSRSPFSSGSGFNGLVNWRI